MHSQSFGFCRQIRLPKVKLNLAFQEYTKIGHPSTLCHSKNLYLNYMVFIPNYNCSGLEGAIMTEMDRSTLWDGILYLKDRNLNI